LRITGILPTMYKRTTSHSPGVVQKAREIWADKVFPTEIPATVAFPRAFAKATPLPVLGPGHEGAKAYVEVAKVLLNQPTAYEGHRPQEVSAEEARRV